MGHVISLEEMRKELDGIRIYDEEKKSDGLMRAAVCGSPTGQANVYKIEKKDMEKAEENGFKLWTFK